MELELGCNRMSSVEPSTDVSPSESNNRRIILLSPYPAHDGPQRTAATAAPYE